MNPRERVVLLFLTATFLVGAGMTAYRRIRLARQQAASPIVVENPVDTTGTEPAPIDLNQARQYELEALPGIGPELARRIISYRQQHGRFRSVRELRQVSGIGPKRYAAICELVTVGARQSASPKQTPHPDSGEGQ